MDLTEEELIAQINVLSNNIKNLKRYVIESIGHNPFEENVNSDTDRASKYLETLMFHILKYHYSTNDNPKKQWLQTINRSLRNFVKILSSENTINRNVINNLNLIFEDIYYHAYIDYANESKVYPDLLVKISDIPTKCPWQLNDFLYKDLKEILNKLGGNKNEI